MKKFIVTDPCYIMNEAQYDNICSEFHCDFEGQEFPLASQHRYSNKPITFHTIEGTSGGDGSMTYKGQSIGVDAGMLCIAECEEGWYMEGFGAKFETLEDAKEGLREIQKHF